MKKFDAFDPVLVRISSNASWYADFYDHLTDDGKKHKCINSFFVKDENILPYNEETKHLHNTIGELTKWKPKKGEPILVRDFDHERWALRIFLEMCHGRFMATAEPEVSCCSALWDQAKPYVNPFKE
jgi:hypothetical protein